MTLKSQPRRSGALFKSTAGIIPTARALKAIRCKHTNAIAACRFRGPVCALRGRVRRVFELGAARRQKRRVPQRKMEFRILNPWLENPLMNAIAFEPARSTAPFEYRCPSQVYRWAAPDRGISFERPISTLRPPGNLNLSGYLLAHDCISFTAASKFSPQTTSNDEHSCGLAAHAAVSVIQPSAVGFAAC
jgi:hypothetical protein